MKNKQLWFSLICVISSFLLQPPSFAQVPQLIHYQGRLLNGTNLVTGTVGLSLRLFNAPSGGVAVYEDSNTVTVVDGLYSTYIGDNTTSGSLVGALASTNVYVEIAVNGVALSPREQMASVAFALSSDRADTLDGIDSTGFSPTVHAHNGADITGGTVAEARIDGAIARDAEIMPAVLANDGAGSTLDADLLDGLNSDVFSTTGHAHDASALVSGTIADARLSTNVSLLGQTIQSSEIENGTIAIVDVATNVFWQVGGNIGMGPGTPSLGTTDNLPLELFVFGGRAFRLEPGLSPNVIGGASLNAVEPGAEGVVIGGGHFNVSGSDDSVIAGGSINRIGTNSTDSAVGGGFANRIGTNSAHSTIAGGQLNRIGDGAEAAAIGGGADNQIGANSFGATIPGGVFNRVGTNAAMAFAAGQRAKAYHEGTFVWADSQAEDFVSTSTNQFLIRASGGVGIGTSVTTNGLLNVAGNVAATSFSGNGAALSGLSGGQLAAGTVSNSHIAGSTVTGDKIAAGTISNSHIAAVAVTGDKIATGTISNSQIAAGSVTGNKIATGTISNANIAANAISGNQIANGTISNADVAANTFWSTTGNAGTVAGTHFLGTTDGAALMLSSAGGVGVGVSNPAAPLHVVRDGLLGVTPNANSIAVFERNAGGFVSVLGPTSTQFGILFGDENTSADGGIIFNNSSVSRGLQFRSGGSTAGRMNITSNGFVGLATTVPEARLHVFDGSAGAAVTAAVSSVAVFENNDDARLSMLTPSSAESAIVFGNDLDPQDGGIYYNVAGTRDLRLRAGGNITRMIITSNGMVGVGTLSPGADLEVSGSIIVTNVLGSMAIESNLTVRNLATLQSGHVNSNFVLRRGSDLVVTNGETVIPDHPFIRFNVDFGAGDPTLNATTAIANGSPAGQILVLSCNTGSFFSVIVPDNANTRLGADRILGKGDTLMLLWDGNDWLELSFGNN